jgi:hypothetical protein
MLVVIQLPKLDQGLNKRWCAALMPLKMPKLDHTNDVHSFIIRINRGSNDKASPKPTRIKIEYVNEKSVQHFSDAGSALMFLKSAFRTVIHGSPT